MTLGSTATATDLARRAAELDDADPLAPLRDRFLPSPGVVAYLDGNSLGRPLADAVTRLDRFVHEEWGGQLIRGWTAEHPVTGPWMHWPERVGDRIAEVALGAAAGQTVVADSTTVLLYKLARAGLDAAQRRDQARREIVVDTDNFPTDRYVLEGIAAERGAVLRWIEPDQDGGITAEQVAAVTGPETALVVASHIAYRSGWIADAAAITELVHDAGALVLWDLCHSVGSFPVELDAWGVDLAVGCTYKYLGGGPGSPAFGYVRAGLHDELRQPIQGWMGRRDPFTMGPGYLPAPGIRSLVSGTPPVLATVPLLASLDLLAEAGIEAVRAKSVALTAFALELVDAWIVPLGATVVSPRDPDRRGGHVTIRRAGFRELLDTLWERGVIPDYREPDGLRLGLSPLSTSFAEVHDGLVILRDALAGLEAEPRGPQ
ncbi:MAG TPA: aminotransferase class V-fold PLP-dependent enzyme [Pseudonocardia sp.]|jgi:kynureninase|nr:aminotransferase class V-fold PLP-dependent enzyme [Pseudonocardia sp.]